MRNVVTISLPNDLLKKLTNEAKMENATRSEVVKLALKQHFLARELDSVREKAMEELARKGVTLTDDDVFSKVS
jgi:metal-responsive CopG/Arc/MetJ family transcriptional regulator